MKGLFMQPPKVAIFPGHIGKDSGAIDRVQGHEMDNIMSIEAVINGQIANLLKVKLDNINIPNDIYIGSFSKRLSESKESSLGISIHCDANKESDCNGFTVFHYPGSVKGLAFARLLHYEMVTFLGSKIRGRVITPHSYYILAKTKFPCVLLECGFITNKSDEEYLNDYYIQNVIAHSILCATINYIGGEFIDK
jgi:N-acetylmuramoyl-L-alanine amidase